MTILTRLTKARDETNLAENAAIRAENALKRGDTAKALTEQAVSRKALSRALYAIEKAIEEAQGTPIPTPTPTPEPEPVPPPQQAPAAWLRLDSIPAVPRNYDPANWTTTTGPSGHSAVDDQASFRFNILPTHFSHADPIFGVTSSHEHLWFNLPEVRNEASHAQLRNGPASIGAGGPINNSIYGIASIRVRRKSDGAIFRLIPHPAVNYYKLEAPGHKLWRENPDLTATQVPRGLKLLGGIKHYDVSRWPWQHGPSPAEFTVWEGNPGNPQQVAGKLKTWKLADILPHCKPGRFVKLDIAFPRLIGDFADSPDHVGHADYYQSGKARRYKKMIPAISMHPLFPLPDFEIDRIFVSSDDDHPELPDGRTAHAYFVEAWDDDFLKRMMDVTFAGNFNTSNGIFGDGTRLTAERASLGLKAGWEAV